MSKEVDSKVVELRFDNAQFEKNAQHSISTIDKLKHALKLDGLAEGFNRIKDSVRQVSFNSINDGINTVKVNFNALQVMAISALNNITNSIVNTGKRVVSTFTLDPIKSGFSEFELKMGSVQTIMASTGASLEDVNRYLQELNTYSDKTIYSFSDMTSNIGKFTNAGVELETAVKAIQGISNEAAISGANANEASRAMYNFSQALSAGAVKLIDWKSIENANMATVEFKQTLIDTATALGTLVTDGDMYVSTTTDMQGKVSESFNAMRNFNNSLSAQWMTTDVLTTALELYSTDIRTMTDAEVEAYEAKLRTIGYSNEMIKKYEEMGKKAFDSAQDVKTFSMMVDTLKESAGSGWATTWEIIIGDFEEGKQLWSNLTKFFDGIISGMNDARNNLLESALGTKFKYLTDVISGVGDSIKNTAETVNGITTEFKDLGDVVDRVINGEFGNLQERWDKLTEAGYNWAEVQNAVNERLGVSKRYEVDAATNSEKLAENTSLYTAQQKEANIEREKQLKLMTALSEEEILALDIADEQKAALIQLKELAEKTGIPIEELISHLDVLDGRWLLIEGFKNIGETLITIFNAVKDAYISVIKPLSADEQAQVLFDIVAGFHKVTKEIKDFVQNEENLKSITSVFKGLFGVLNLVKTVLSTGFKIAVGVASTVLRMFGTNFVDLTGKIGDALYNVSTFITENIDLKNVIGLVAAVIYGLITAVKSLIDAFLKLPAVQYIVKNFATIVKTFAKDFGEYLSGGVTAILGFIERCKQLNGLSFDNIKTIFVDFIKNVLGYFFNFTNQFSGLKKIIEDVSIAFSNFFTNNINKPTEKGISLVSTFIDKISSLIKLFGKNIKYNVGIGEILTMLSGGALIVVMVKLSKFVSSVSDAIESISDIGEAVSGAFESLGGAFDALKKSFKADATLKIAEAIALLAASMILLSLIPFTKVLQVEVELLLLSGIVAGLWLAMTKISANAPDIIVAAGAIMAIAASVGILVASLYALKKMTGSDPAGVATAFVSLVGIMSALLLFVGLLVLAQKDLAIGASAILSIAVSVALLTGALALLGNIELKNPEALYAVVSLIVAFGLIMAALKAIPGKGGATAVMPIVACAGAVYLAVLALMQLALFPASQIEAATTNMLKIMACLLGFSALLSLLSYIAGANAAKVGMEMLAMSVAINVLAHTIGVINQFSEPEIEYAKKFINGILLVFAALSLASKWAGANAAKVGVTLLAAAGALVILVGVIVILSHIDAAPLAKAVGAVSVLMLIFGGLIALTHFAGEVQTGPLVAMSVAIGLILIAVGAMAMIPAEQLWNAVGAISVALIAFAAVEAASALIKGCFKTMVAMAVAIGIIGTILIVMSALETDTALKNAAALSMVMLAMGAVMLITSLMAPVLTAALKTLLIMAGVVALIGTILVLMNLPAWGSMPEMLERALSLSAVMLAMAVTCLIMSKIPASAAVTAALSLLAFVVVLGSVFVALFAIFGALVDTDLINMNYVNQGIEALSTIASGIGEFVGSIAGGAIKGLIESLPSIGDQLTAFMDKIAGFIDGVNQLDTGKLEGVKTLASTILALTEAEFINGINSLSKALVGDNNSDVFGASLGMFAQSLVSFGNTLKQADIDWEALKPAMDAAYQLTEIAKNIPNEGGEIAKWIGDNDAGSFGVALGAFGSGLGAFATAVAGVDWSGVPGSMDAANKIVEVAKIIPNSEGVLSFWVGNNDIDDFGAKIETFAIGLSAYATTVATTDFSGITDSIGATWDLVTMAQIVTEGLKDTNMYNVQSFGETLESFGESLKNYETFVAGKNWSDVRDSANAAKRLAAFAKELSEAGKKYDLNYLGSQLTTFAPDLELFYNGINDIDTDRLSSVGKALNDLATAIAVLTDILNKSGLSSTYGLDKFGAELKEFGPDLLVFYNNIYLVKGDKLNEIVESVSKLADMLNLYSDSTADSFVKSMKNLAGLSITGIIAELKNSHNRLRNVFDETLSFLLTYLKKQEYRFKNAGQSASTSYANGILTNKEIIKDAISKLITSDMFQQHTEAFYTAGKNVVQGFADGIYDSALIVKNAADSAANITIDTTKETLDEHSPSKVAEDIGENWDLGLANGINNNASVIDDSMSNTLKASISKIDASGLGEELAKIMVKGYSDTTKNTTNIEKLTRSYVSMFANAKKSILGDGSVIRDSFALRLYLDSDEYEEDRKNYIQKQNELAEKKLKREKLLAKQRQNTAARAREEHKKEAEEAVANNNIVIASDTNKANNSVATTNTVSKSVKTEAEAREEANRQAAYASHGISVSYKSEGEAAQSSAQVQEDANTKISDSATASMEKITDTVVSGSNGLISTVKDGASKLVGNVKNILSGFGGKLSGLISSFGIGAKDLEQKLKDFATSNGLDVESLTSKYGSLTEALNAGDSAFSNFLSTIPGFNDYLKGTGMTMNELYSTIGNTNGGLNYLNGTISTTSSEISQLDNEISALETDLNNYPENIKTKAEKAYNDMKDSIKNNIEEATSLIKQNLDIQLSLLEEYSDNIKTVSADILNTTAKTASADPFAAKPDTTAKKTTDKKDELTPEKTLENMKYNATKLVDYTNYIAALESKGLSDSLLQHIKDLGPEGVEQVKVFLRMTSDEIAKANEYYNTALEENSRQDPVDIVASMKRSADKLHEYNEYISKLEAKGLSDNLLKHLKDLGPEGVDQIKAFLEMTSDQIAQANSYYNAALEEESKEHPIDILVGMRGQLADYESWQADLAKLATMGINDALYAELEALGPAGAEKIKAFLKMTGDQIDEANKMYTKKAELTGKELLKNWNKSIEENKLFANNLKLLVDKKFPPELIKEISTMGAEAGNKFMDALLSMDETERKELIKTYEDTSKTLGTTLSQNIMDTVAGSYYIEDSKNILMDSFSLVGKYIDLGIIKGIEGNSDLVKDGLISMCDQLVDTAEAELGIHSPSKRFEEIGNYIILGLVNGLYNNEKDVASEMQTLTNNLVTDTIALMAKAMQVINGNANLSPTITPVLDMSNATVDDIQLNANVDTIAVNSVASMQAFASEVSKGIENSSARIENEIKDLRTDIMNAYNGIANREVAIYVDSKKLASSTARNMDRELGKITYRRR